MTYSRNRVASGKTDWATPQWLYDLLNDEFHFDVDVCADASNAKAPMYYTQEVDGLKQRWQGTCWMNPPYGREINLWVCKAFSHAFTGDATLVCLLPAATDNRWWWTYCRRGEVRFLPGRLRFETEGRKLAPANFPSAIVIFRAANICAKTLYWEVRAPGKGNP